VYGWIYRQLAKLPLTKRKKEEENETRVVQPGKILIFRVDIYLHKLKCEVNLTDLWQVGLILAAYHIELFLFI